MNQCAQCRSLIVFNGTRQGNLWFCNARCAEKGYPLVVAETVPGELARARAGLIHSGGCPVCKGAGPADVHKSHLVWAFGFYTTWRSNERISCRRCGIKSQVRGIMSSLVFGWWSLRGLLVTPLQVFRNIRSMIKAPHPGQPSESLVRSAALDIAREFIARQRGRNKCPSCGLTYELADYRQDLEHIYCSGCKTELARN